MAYQHGGAVQITSVELTMPSDRKSALLLAFLSVIGSGCKDKQHVRLSKSVVAVSNTVRTQTKDASRRNDRQFVPKRFKLYREPKSMAKWSHRWVVASVFLNFEEARKQCTEKLVVPGRVFSGLKANKFYCMSRDANKHADEKLARDKAKNNPQLVAVNVGAFLPVDLSILSIPRKSLRHVVVRSSELVVVVRRNETQSGVAVESYRPDGKRLSRIAISATETLSSEIVKSFSDGNALMLVEQASATYSNAYGRSRSLPKHHFIVVGPKGELLYQGIHVGLPIVGKDDLRRFVATNNKDIVAIEGDEGDVKLLHWNGKQLVEK